CTFLCLTGAVIGLKLQEHSPPESPSVAVADPGEPVPIEDPPADTRSQASGGRASLNASPRDHSVDDTSRRNLGSENRTRSAGKRENLSDPSAFLSSLNQMSIPTPTDSKQESKNNNRSGISQNSDSTTRKGQEATGSPTRTGNSSTITMTDPTGF